jgi:hypothetical protein
MSFPSGVHWAGDGTEVQRDDDSEAFPGDMEAALAVANAGYPWLVYFPQEEDYPWSVFAFSRRDDAIAASRDTSGSFCFDGRRGCPPSGEGGIGYVAPDWAERGA